MVILYPINGTVYDTDGTTELANITVTLRNERTNETINVDTNSSGQYILECNNLASEFADGDVVTIFVVYSNKEDYEEHTIVSSNGGATVNLTLSTVPASDTLKYFTVQDYLTFFGLSAGNEGVPLTNEIVAVGTMVEKEIEELTKSEFSVVTNTVTDEYHDAVSDFQVDWFTKYKPIVSITSFYVNSAEEDETASWTELTEANNQIKVDLETGRIRITGDLDDDSQSNYPEPGVKQVKLTYTYGRSSVPKDIKKLAILMTARDFIKGAVAKALMRGQDSFKTDHYTVLDSQIESLLNRYKHYDIINT